MPPLPTFSAPRIVYAKPRWNAYVPGLCGMVEVEASFVTEAKLAAAKQLRAHVQSVIVSPAYDPTVTRFGARA